MNGDGDKEPNLYTPSGVPWRETNEAFRTGHVSRPQGSLLAHEHDRWWRGAHPLVVYRKAAQGAMPGHPGNDALEEGKWTTSGQGSLSKPTNPPRRCFPLERPSSHVEPGEPGSPTTTSVPKFRMSEVFAVIRVISAIFLKDFLQFRVGTGDGWKRLETWPDWL